MVKYIQLFITIIHYYCYTPVVMCLSLLLLLVSNTTTTNSSVSVAAAAAVIPHMSDVLSSLEAAVASLNLGRSFLFMTHDTHAILGLELTELALDQHRRLLHLCNKVLTLNEIANYQCIAARACIQQLISALLETEETNRSINF